MWFEMGNTYFLTTGVHSGAATMEINVQLYFFFLNLEQKSYPMIHLYHSWAYTPKMPHTTTGTRFNDIHK